MNILTAAKINLFIQIVARDDRGYHHLNSFFAYTDICDKISINSANENSLIVSGKYGHLLDNDPKQNLIFQILDSFNKVAGKHYRFVINLEKNIPIGAGLGGGSANAGYFLRYLNDSLDKKLGQEELENIVIKHGSDISFFLQNNSRIIEGCGEIFGAKVSFPTIPALLIYPKIILGAGDVYKKYKEISDFSKLKPIENDVKILTQQDFVKFLKQYGNDLEDAAKDICPEINKIFAILEQDKDLALARMTGSGSCCFAIYNENVDLKAKLLDLQNNNPNWDIVEFNIKSNC